MYYFKSRRTVQALMLAGAAIVGILGGLDASAQARGCDRSCLTAVLDNYLEALAAGDASRLPLHYSVKYTENGQRLNLTDGLWRTFTSGPHYRFDIVDEESAQIAMLGIVDENGNRNFFSVRLAVEQHELMGRGVEITEIENLVVRNITAGGSASMDPPRPEFLRTVPEGERLSRGEMIRIANSYFTGLDTDQSAEHVPFHPDCRRLENGMLVANNPDPSVGEMMNRTCAEQFDTGFSIIVTDIRERRFPIVDRERGLVYALAFFDHDGAVTPNTVEPGQPLEDRMRAILQPFSFMIAEVFQIENGTINQIEAVLATVPYKMESGW